MAAQRLGGPQVQLPEGEASIINAAAIYLYRQSRFQPISQLNPETLSSQLSEWNVGTMRRFSLTMDAIENRDPLVKSTTGKLKQSLSRRDFEVVKVDGADPDKAELHANKLKEFYSNIEATNAVDRNIRGGFSTLVQQMMDAALKRYAVHEIIWRPVGDEMDKLTATFVFVPLWFFENRTGCLRFCGNFAWDGIPMKDGQWVVTCGDGIMEAISVAWMYKTIALRDWMIYSEKHGMPGIVGKTQFQKDTPGWNAMKDAVEAVSTDFSAVIGQQDDIDAVQFGQTGQLPYPPLVEYMDKAISALARGADLSTLSAGNTAQGQGASLQGDESDLIEQHYGQMISETLNHYVDPHVIKWHFGEGEEPCAYVKLNVPKRKDAQVELEIDNALTGMGILQAKSSICERYGRTEATDEQIADGDVIQGAGALPQQPTGPNGEPLDENGNLLVSPERKQWLQDFRQKNFEGSRAQDLTQRRERFQRFRELAPARERLANYRQSRQELLGAANLIAKNATNELKPLVEQLNKIASMANEEHFIACIRALRSELPQLADKAERTTGNANSLLAVFEAVNNPALN